MHLSTLPDQTPPKAFTVLQFSLVYRVGRSRVFEEIAAGRLASYRVGKRRYISAAAGEAWQAALEAETAAAHREAA